PHVRAVEEGAAGPRVHTAALDVRILHRVDVDGEAVRMHRPALRPWRDRVAAVEAGRVVVLEGALVLALVRVDRPHPPDREASSVEPTENPHDVAHSRDVDHERTR